MEILLSENLKHDTVNPMMECCEWVCLQVHAVIGVLMDDTDPLVTVMKVEKAPQETYADIGGLDSQIQEIKVQDMSNAQIFFLYLLFIYLFFSYIDC